MKPHFTERAKHDIESGFWWYEKRRRGLGFDFIDSVNRSIQSILSNPEIYPIRYDVIRSCPVRRFPFSVFYTVEDAQVVVHTVFDDRQDPVKRP